VGFIKAFLGATKRKRKGRICLYLHLGKFHDSILFDAEQTGTILSQVNHIEMEKFLDFYKKETVIAKREGEVE
jgi:hypothetical protein